MAATVRVSYYNGSTEPSTGATAEGGLKFNRVDTLTGTTAIPIPTSAGTNYSWYKLLALDVTSTGTTAITNRTIARSSAPPAGIKISWATTDAYVQASSANRPADTSTGDDAIPSGYTEGTTSGWIYAAASVGTSSGRNSDFAKVLIGVSSTATYTGGAGSSMALPNLTISYDEA